ncbi:hypothetical protein H4P12_08480 [Paracoccus sp. 11-3]|uniref:Uncharacterized protein n=1 Tax=Paracoccus amoyensis TaxID=2760093 RepID=A0A926GGR3_9RHOB|nr:hypothetical protein [Paracoccus amoyensis]MBC9246747.1 hypothetical protein [Paracoccus amoyensis]
MAYSFPLTTAQFLSYLPIQDMSFDIPEAIELSETGGGEILTADLGTRLWEGEVILGILTEEERDFATAMLDVLRRPGASFLVHDVRRPAPRHDPDGTILGNRDVVLDTVSGNNRELRLAGLPVGYQFRRHDYLAFRYGSDPVRYALHRIAEPGSSDVSGVTGLIEITPNIRPGWTPRLSVTLHRAACKAIVLPGSFDPGRRRGTMTEGMRFRFRQTLR